MIALVSGEGSVRIIGQFRGTKDRAVQRSKKIGRKKGATFFITLSLSKKGPVEVFVYLKMSGNLEKHGWSFQYRYIAYCIVLYTNFQEAFTRCVPTIQQRLGYSSLPI